MNKNNLKMGIVILNYKTWEKTISCVQSIIETYRGDKVIVIVDNKSPNESFEKLSKVYCTSDFEEVKVVQTDRNGGFSYGNNYGFRYIRDNFPEIEKIVITNNDIIFQTDAIRSMLDGFNTSKAVVMTAPKIYDIKGNATNVPWKKKPNLLQELYLADCSPCVYTWEELNDDVFAYMVSGCCFTVDKDLFASIGGLDENVFLYNEENIISKKIADAQLKIVYSPLAGVVHDHGSTTGNSTIFVDKEYAKSSLYFFEKYEEVTALQLMALKAFYILRITAKCLLGKYANRDGYLNGVREIVSYQNKEC